MKVSIVIPVYNNFVQLNDLLVNIFEHSSPHEVLLVDDMSPDPETKRGLKWWGDNYKDVEVISMLRNSGFLKTSNFGLKIAKGDIICLISTDVIIETDIVRLLRIAIGEKPNRLIGGTVYNGSTGWNQFGATIFPYAEGWLLATTRDGWDALGYFDERFSPNDFEDVDLSTTALHTGFELYSLNNPKVRHIGGQSIGYNEQREELTKANRKKFEAKWITKSSKSE